MAIEIDSTNNKIDGGSNGFVGDLTTGNASIQDFNYIKPNYDYTVNTSGVSQYSISNLHNILYNNIKLGLRFLPMSSGITNGLNIKITDSAGTTNRSVTYQQTFKMTASGNTNTVVEYWNTSSSGLVDLCGGTYGVGTTFPSHRGLQMIINGCAMDFSNPFFEIAPSLIIDTLWPISSGINAHCQTHITASNNTQTGYDWEKLSFYFDTGNLKAIAFGGT